MQQDSKILTGDAVNFLSKLHNKFNQRRLELLKKRADRQELINAGELPDFLPETTHIRNDTSWKIAETPEDLKCRYVEITGPTDRKMMINAFNSGADVFMADFEDANSPTWDNLIEGQINLKDAIDGTISLVSTEGKKYALNDKIAVLFVRPRGLHLNEKRIIFEGQEMSGSLFDFGLFMFHNASKMLQRGLRPYLYLPKMQSHLEAGLWNDVFIFTQKELGIPVGTIRATVLIETILAVFEMEEILYELRDHSAGLNAGRWDYIFSIIKTFRRNKNLKLPNRDQITMTVPFMRAYTELLVKTCHKRGAHAIGGMAAFIPNKNDPEITKIALKKVREDKLREAQDGFDGTWVAHPDLVKVAREIFVANLKGKPNQKERMREDSQADAQKLLDFRISGGTITEEGLRHNINVALQYVASWLTGQGAAAIYNLMEDTATAEISRAQIWQWINSGSQLNDGRKINRERVFKMIEEEMKKIAQLYGQHYNREIFAKARNLFEELIFAEKFIEFLTLPGLKDL